MNADLAKKIEGDHALKHAETVDKAGPKIGKVMVCSCSCRRGCTC